MARGQELYRRAKELIPGGTQLLSKRPEMFLPEHWPSYFDRAKGVEVTDLDGNTFIDMSINGIGACVLGAADPDVDRAVMDAIERGTMSTLNCREEVELAELLIELHPWAQMCRFARCGGEAMAIAVRIARAVTGKDHIAFCGYHGWHDWYLSANLGSPHALDEPLLPGLEPKGVPRGLKGTTHPFRYNAPDELPEIARRHGRELAAIVMEPIRSTLPIAGFLEGARDIATSLGIPLVFDEVSSGLRLSSGGAHLALGIEPDIAVFAKALGNGYPMAAVIGRSKVMSAASDCFISSTYWTERIGPAAALATLRKHRAHRVHEHLDHIGSLVQEGWRSAAERAGLSVLVCGMKPMSHFAVRHEKAKEAHTFFTQAMLERGYLAGPAFYATFAHTEEHVTAYLVAVAEVFKEISDALREDSIGTKLEGPVAHTGFRRLT